MVSVYFKENKLLSRDEFKIALLLYVDEFEVANPFGTSRKIHKVCAVYWVLANLPIKYRSSLHTIQLALLCKANDLKQSGYAKVFGPLLHDLVILEKEGVFIESVGECIQGTVLYVLADNLAAHGLAGFNECFTAQYMCRFYMAI